MKKIVGLSSSRIMMHEMKYSTLKQHYTKCIEKVGGIPFIIPLLSDENSAKEIVSRIEVLFLTGGDDVHPIFYNEEPKASSMGNDLQRDYIESALLKAADEKGIPVFGICRGMQFINCFYGGNLYQDIETQVKNPINHFCQSDILEYHHSIELLNESFLKNIYKTDRLLVNSLHHQSVKDVAKGFEICAKAKDGIIEAIENKEKKIYAVQFHPESMSETDSKFLEIFKFMLSL